MVRRLAVTLTLFGLALGLPYNRRIQYAELHFTPSEAEPWTPYGGSQQFHEQSYGRTRYSKQYGGDSQWKPSRVESPVGSLQFIDQHSYSDLDMADQKEMHYIMRSSPPATHLQYPVYREISSEYGLRGYSGIPMEPPRPTYKRSNDQYYQQYSPSSDYYQRPQQNIRFREPPYPTTQYPNPPFPVPYSNQNMQNSEYGQQRVDEAVFGQQEQTDDVQFGVPQSSEMDQGQQSIHVIDFDDSGLGQQLTETTEFEEPIHEVLGQQQIDDAAFGQRSTDNYGQGVIQQTGIVELGQQQTDDVEFGQEQIEIELGQQTTDEVSLGQQQIVDEEFGQQQTGDVDFGQQQIVDIEFGQQQMENLEFGQQQTDDAEFGQQQVGNVEFGQQQTDDVEFGQQQTDDVEFGQQKIGNVEFGQQQTDDVEFGQQQLDEVSFGQQPTDNYGQEVIEVLEEKHTGAVELGQQQTDDVEFGQEQIEIALGQQTTDEVSFGQQQTDDVEFGQQQTDDAEFRQKQMEQEIITMHSPDAQSFKYEQAVKGNELDADNSMEQSKLCKPYRSCKDLWNLKKSPSLEKDVSSTEAISKKTSYIYHSENAPAVEEEIKPARITQLGLAESKAERYKLIGAFLDELERDIKQSSPRARVTTTNRPFRIRRQTFEENFSSEEKSTGFWDNVGKKIKTTYEKAKEKTKEIYEDVKDKIKGSEDDD